MKINQKIFQDKNPRPKSSKYINNLPRISFKNKKEYPIISISERESNFDFNINLIPKIEAEKIYKENLDLKETIKELKKILIFIKQIIKNYLKQLLKRTKK